jgi:TolA-binding protein
MVDQIIDKLEKQHRRQVRFQRYGNAVLILAFVLLLSAAGLVKLHSNKAIDRIEADAEIIQRQSAAIDRLEFTLDRQEQQLAEKDSIIAAQQELIAGQAGYIQSLKKENDKLREANEELAQKLENESTVIDSPLNRVREP